MGKGAWLGALGVCALIGIVCLIRLINAPEYPASAPGLLDNSYSEVRSRRGGTRYEVTYSFEVDGKRYRGDDSIRSEPRVAATTVYYDPNDPNDNGLSKRKDEAWVFVGLALAVVGGFHSVKRLASRAA